MNHEAPFVGTLELALSLGVFGARTRRQVAIEYAHTPSWEFYDPQKKDLQSSHPATNFYLFIKLNTQQRQLLKLPPGAKLLECPGLLSLLMASKRIRAMLEHLTDVDARTTDNARRKAAGLAVEHELKLI